MNRQADLGRRLAEHFGADAPSRAPDWVLRGALTTIDDTRQRRVLIAAPWRYLTVNRFTKLAAAAVAAVAVGILGFSVLRPGPGTGGPQTPTQTPTASPTIAPTPTVPADLTQAYTSATNGFSISYPAGWGARPASEPWTTGIPYGGALNWDNFNDGSTSHFVGVASQPLAGTAFDEWAAALVAHPDWGDTCDPTTEPVTIDGAIGLLASHCPDDDVLSAFVAAADRGYIFVGFGLPDRAYFEAILATVRLHPEDAVDTGPSPSS